MLNVTYKDEVIEKIQQGNLAFLCDKCSHDDLKYNFKDGMYRETLHVPKSGGDWQPIFISMLSIADFHRELMEKV